MPSGIAPSKFAACKVWLAQQLADGRPHIVGGLIATGFMQGFGEQTICRAAKALRVHRSSANHGASKRSGTTVEIWYLMKEAS